MILTALFCNFVLVDNSQMHIHFDLICLFLSFEFSCFLLTVCIGETAKEVLS